MNHQAELVFQGIAAAGYVLITVIRGYHHRQARKFRRGGVYREGVATIWLKSLLGTLGTLSLLLYVISPAWLAWTAFPCPLWLRWTGAGLGLAAILLQGWVHHHLGHNFSPFIVLSAEHTLAVNGPYRWVRHPMYTTFYLSIIGWTLLSANWLVGLSWAGLGVVVAFQTRTEEAALLAHFGGQYRAYQQRTGRFLPRLARQPNFYNW